MSNRLLAMRCCPRPAVREKEGTMVSTEGMTGADRAGDSTEPGAPSSGLPDPASHTARTALQHTHSTVCMRRAARREHHAISGRPHHQLGYRERQADRSRYSSGRAGDHTLLSPHPRPRSVIRCLVITVALGVLYLALMDVIGLDGHPELTLFGLLVIVFGGAVVENAIRLDGMTDQHTPDRSPRRVTVEPSATPGLPA